MNDKEKLQDYEETRNWLIRNYGVDGKTRCDVIDKDDDLSTMVAAMRDHYEYDY